MRISEVNYVRIPSWIDEFYVLADQFIKISEHNTRNIHNGIEYVAVINYQQMNQIGKMSPSALGKGSLIGVKFILEDCLKDGAVMKESNRKIKKADLIALLDKFSNKM